MGARRVRRRFRVRGIVQGVGFRPFVFGLANGLGLGGFARNDPDGLLVEVEGPSEAVAGFRAALVQDAPPLAVVDRVEEEAVRPRGELEFRILASARSGAARTPISPDIATCDECLSEVLDPNARRHGYAFTNCTNCGPRYTITTGIPYDRATTTMADFPMCDACAAEYEDPRDRRFHAQPIACPACGPQLRLVDPNGDPLEGDAIQGAARLLRLGRIVAVKGLGGYHLACDATNGRAVGRLRARKRREEKPLAVMVARVEDAGALVRLDDAAAAVLASPRRPIVPLPRRPGAPVADEVAPGNRFLGVMLPYTPLHHLLLRAVSRPLVLTSGNLSDEPIAHADDDARARLGRIADAFVVHDRAIRVRCDDSVVRVVAGGEYPVRRSRGYAPEPLRVEPPFDRPVLAAGAELKHTFCLGMGPHAVLSHHIGDLEAWPAMAAFLDGVEHFKRVFEVSPDVIAHDLHPEYLSTKWALGVEGVRAIGVQHHHAHIASCLADNGRTGPAIGLALDGAGYGEDGAIWGCEVLVCDLARAERRMHLRYVPMPGGAAAVAEPWRMAAVYLEAAFGAAVPRIEVVRRADERWAAVLAMARAGVNSPSTSSAGRLFDAAAAVCGVRAEVAYEGQAAAELEQVADPSGGPGYPCPVRGHEIDGVALIAALAEDVRSGRPVSEAAAGFHAGLADALTRACRDVRDEDGFATVALSGGTWQNVLLLRLVRARLEACGFEVLVHRRVPPNDGGISLGQAVVANARGQEVDRSL